MSKKLKAETLEEFLARGGSIQKIPYVEPEQSEETIRATTSGGLPEIMTLSDGAHFFGETRKKKPNKKDFLERINNSSLPQSVIESLTKKIRG